MLYWAFAEYGMAALSHEEVWMTICVCRFSQTNKLAGAASCLFQQVLQLFYGDVHNIMVSGVSVELHDGSNLHLVGRASVLLADIPAIKERTQRKGHTGIVCCPRCVSATQHKKQRFDSNASPY